MVRRYNAWVGNPRGCPENTSLCIAEVCDRGRSMIIHQCSRKRGHGPGKLYCKQHAKKLADKKHVFVPCDRL
jgi:hypothetical protein